MPKDHTSLFSSVLSSYTSGAMYIEVPLTVDRLEELWFSGSERPKSPSLIRPLSEMNRLSGLMSYG